MVFFFFFISIQNTEENFQKKILKERIARLSGGIAILQVLNSKTVILPAEPLIFSSSSYFLFNFE